MAAMNIGVLPLGRPTFDVPFAEQKLAAMLAALDALECEILGPRNLLMDEAATLAAMEALTATAPDQIMILQATFTDASAVVAAADRFDQPISIWATPEPRLGERLRLNSFCGLNLASHALGRNQRAFSWLYADPEGDVAAELEALIGGRRSVRRLSAAPAAARSPDGARISNAISGRRIARIGEHPTGFDTCAYSADAIQALVGVEVDALALEDLFDAARAAPADDVTALRAAASAQLSDIGDVDQAELDRSLRLKAGLEAMRAKNGYDAFAIRCWPEAFTEYGGAVCGPASMMGEGRTPCACEADVYGALTQLILQEAAEAPVFLTDLVDIDVADGTGVVWHCGQAPISMRDPAAPLSATVHSNRKMPLLYQFPLKPGPVTFMRVSQAFNEPKMVLGFGEMLSRPMAFTGTSGVLRFARPAGNVINDVMASGLEHHVALAYGDHRDALRAVAAELRLPLLEI